MSQRPRDIIAGKLPTMRECYSAVLKDGQPALHIEILSPLAAGAYAGEIIRVLRANGYEIVRMEKRGGFTILELPNE